MKIGVESLPRSESSLLSVKLGGLFLRDLTTQGSIFPFLVSSKVKFSKFSLYFFIECIIFLKFFFFLLVQDLIMPSFYFQNKIALTFSQPFGQSSSTDKSSTGKSL